MPKLTEEDLITGLDFKCERCQAECTRINAAEPELGYISKVDGEFTVLCKDCWNELPDEEKRIKSVPDTAFLVIIKNNGEGVYMTTEDVSIKFMRDPTPYDVIAACDTISNDVKTALTNNKLLARMVPVMQQMIQQMLKPSKLVIPK
jgi:hypothetical protein